MLFRFAFVQVNISYNVFIDFVYFGWLAAGKNTHKSREIRRGKDEHFRLLACVPDHHIVVVVVVVLGMFVWVVPLIYINMQSIYIYNIYKLIREKQNFLYLLYIYVYIIVVVPTINLCSEMGENIYNNELKRCGC